MRLKKYAIYIVFGIFVLLTVQGIVWAESSNPDANIHNVWDGIWYMVITLTTVGYGDYYPVTALGKAMSLSIVFASLGILSYVFGEIASYYSKLIENRKLGRMGTKMENHFIVVHYDDFAKEVIKQIVHANHKIAVVTESKDQIDLIKDNFKENVFAFFTDYENYESYQKVNIEKASRVYVNLNDDSKTLIFCINLLKWYKNIELVVSLNSMDLKETFQSIGINYIISRNQIASKLLGSYIFEPDVANFTEELITTSREEEDLDIFQLHVNAVNPYANKEFLESFIDIKKQYDGVLLGLANEKQGVIKSPKQDRVIQPDDYLIIMSSEMAKKRIEKAFGVKEGKI